jgi:PAS domain S-box-containing protein
MVRNMSGNSVQTQTAQAEAAADALDELPLPYLETDAEGKVTRANRAAMELHPIEQGALIGRMAWELLATDEMEKSYAAYLSCMMSGEDPPAVQRSFYTRHGEFRTYEIYRSLIRDGEGQPAGMRMVCVDVTQFRRELETAQRARMGLESVMASVADAVIVTDALGFIRAVNPAAEVLVGWKAQELTGKLIEKALPLLDSSSESGRPLNFTMALEGHCKGIATVLCSQGRHVRMEITASPIIDKETGFTTGMVSISRRMADQ